MDRAEYLRQLHSRFRVSQGQIMTTVTSATGKTVVGTDRIIKGDEYEVHQVRLHDDSVVYLRVAFPGTPASKIEHESWAMARARENGVPAPDVLAVTVISNDEGERPAMVVRSCPGRPLAEVLPVLPSEQRAAAMHGIGRVLAVLHSTPMPGFGRPMADGRWPDLYQEQAQYLSNCLVAADQLTAADFSDREAACVKDILRREQPQHEDPVLCHGDVSPEHVFVDPDLRVVGLIDWGMWSASPAIAELAGLAMTMSDPDRTAVLAGYGQVDISDHAIRWHAIAQLVGQIGWLVSSNQTNEIHGPAATLRTSLAEH